MDNLLFQEGIPEGFTTAFEAGIFHQEKHIYLQSEKGWHTFVFIDTNNKRIVALIHIHIENEIARSPYRSPYGSFIFTNGLTHDQLQSFILQTEQCLLKKGVATLFLKNPPEEHYPNQIPLLNQTLLELKYMVDLMEMSSIIPITNTAFEKHIHRSEKKRLRKCRDAGFTFKLMPFEDLSLCYRFLKQYKVSKGYAISMTYEELHATLVAFPTLFILSSIEFENKMIAANISIIVNQNTLYNFYHDHDAAFDQYSPVVMLNEGLFQFCQKNHFRLLDLGTSSIGNKSNESLLNFKKRLGAIQSPKYSFRKDLK